MRLILAFPAAVLAALAVCPAASASAPTPFPVYDSGRALVTAHHVTSGERLVIKGHPVTLGAVTHPGPAYIAHILGRALPLSWRNHELAAVPEG